ncbi:MAG TPA: chemotaxis protein CheA [Vicinamibacteria bacterium]|nr:chemotaxis protein CheA [Vicinamibacteria bacterium]
MAFEVSAELVGIYLEDAREHLAVLDGALLRLEREGTSPELLGSLLGPLHTLKGNSGMMGFSAVKDYVHRLEEVFARARDGALQLDAAGVDCLLRGASALREAIEAACATGGEQRPLQAEQAELAALVAAAPARRAPAAAAPQPLAPAAGAPEAPAPAAEAGEVAAAARARSSMVRVDFAKLDQLLNLVGELIVHRTKLALLGRQIAATVPEAGPQLLEAVHQVGAVSSQLQEMIMDVRMLPIRHVFARFPRLVRDLAHSQGKSVELVLQGEETRVDKAVIDELGEPLVHLIRNAVDHGIERPELRTARGKSATGTILLSAAQESNQVVITVIDDGGGIDAAEVRSKAVERGLVREDEALSDREAIQLIFAEGFSTARAVTDVSGRGVGLDVVVQSMERLNGLIEAETIPGAGTKFTLQLPLTLAIITVLMVEVAGGSYALPSGSVVESLRYRSADVVRMNGRDTLRVRDRIVPLLHLCAHFGLRSDERTERYAVIVGRGDKRLGLTVDRLLGQQDVVIKALDQVVAEGPIQVAGATILGDGRVVLILDIAALFEGRRGRLARGARATEA